MSYSLIAECVSELPPSTDSVRRRTLSDSRPLSTTPELGTLLYLDPLYSSLAEVYPCTFHLNLNKLKIRYTDGTSYSFLSGPEPGT